MTGHITKVILVLLALCLIVTSSTYAYDDYTARAPLKEWESTSFGKNLELKKEMHRLWGNGYFSQYVSLAIQIIVAEKIIEGTKICSEK